jgi:hypothetical protein
MRHSSVGATSVTATWGALMGSARGFEEHSSCFSDQDRGMVSAGELFHGEPTALPVPMARRSAL